MTFRLSAGYDYPINRNFLKCIDTYVIILGTYVIAATQVIEIKTPVKVSIIITP
jgi:hypothetical protein